MRTAPLKVLVTGATGMLGRSLMRTLAQAPAKYEVVGTAFTRADGAALRKLDLRDEAAVAGLQQQRRAASSWRHDERARCMMQRRKRAARR